MCEFCHKHGEGQEWYLQARNYSEDLLSDMRRRKFIEDFTRTPDNVRDRLRKADGFMRLPPFVRGVMTPMVVNRQKKAHYGQVLPIEEVGRIFAFVNSVFRFSCNCRQATTGCVERYCYGVSMVTQDESRFAKILGGSYLAGPDTGGLETLSKDEALVSLRELEKEGLCHTVWTFITPFIGGICNCHSDCPTIKSTTMGLPVIFRAEYVAEVKPEACNGCRQCMRLCQFGAMGFSVANKKVVIDPRRCYGCGICRSLCTKDAIVLNERSSVPLAAHVW